jgi:alanine racemase
MFSWVEISESAVRFNLQQFRNVVGKKNLLMPVIKSNAYGHGFGLIARICDNDKNVDRICVVNSVEALDLIKLKIKKPIIILSFYSEDKNDLKKLISRGVVFPVYRFDQINLLNAVAKSLKKKVKIHIKIDTGTSRVGFFLADLVRLSSLIKKAVWLETEGIWSHFASSEDNVDFTIKQYKIFQKAIHILNAHGIKPILKHISCTAALLGFNFIDLNAGRLGLGLYGLCPDKRLLKTVNLRPVLSWKAKIIQVKTLLKGTKIGYGGSFVVKKKTKIIILPVGYWDGYVRLLSNVAKVLINGKLYPVRGRVCMNLMMVEMPIGENVKEGNIATLIGKEGKNFISAENIAEWSQTINYEVVTRINPLIPRLKIK